MLAEYYDRIYANKDYEYEAESILGILDQFPEHVLDIGTGTGNHAFAFAKRGAKVVGIDIDCAMIRRAKHKAKAISNPPSFSCVDVSQILGTFDLIVSLFNVVNYIGELGELLIFFQSCRRLLMEGGTFVFDCWNGIAAILDSPRVEIRKAEFLTIHVCPDIDLMNQSVMITNHVKSAGDDFVFDYHARLWMPWQLKSALILSGFEMVKSSAWMHFDESATENMWKIMFLCQ